MVLSESFYIIMHVHVNLYLYEDKKNIVRCKIKASETVVIFCFCLYFPAAMTFLLKHVYVNRFKSSH